MSEAQITASDITNWNSLDDIAASFEKRGLKPLPEISDDGRLVLELADGEFIELVEASTGKSATDYKPGSVTRHTNLVATDDYETFTFVTRIRDWDAHGRIKYQQFSFEKEQFRRDSGEKNTVLQKLNEIEYGKSAAVMDDLYDTRQIVKAFYEQFESLRTGLVQEVAGIPDDRGDAKQRYVQVLLDRMIFLYFIQEKNLLDYDAEYLHSHQKRVVDDGGDVYEEFYDPLFFELLAEGKNDPEFGKLPYLNGGLFSKNPIEEEFEDAKLGASAEETNQLFGRIIDFLSDWNWNVDERLDIVDPKNLSPAVLGHIFEQTVNQKEMGAYYTPEEITGFMSRRTIHPYLLDQLNEAEGTSYESIDEVFALDTIEASSDEAAVADGGAVTQAVDTGSIDQDHVETLYFDVLKQTRVLDPAVGSGAFLLAAQEVLLDVYLQCLDYFVAREDEEPWELTSRIKDELESIRETKGSETLYAKRSIILNNLYGVDIDEGAIEICKLRLWLSMVADIEDEPGEVEPLPNIDFNIRQGNSLIGFTEVVEVATDQGDAALTNFGGGIGESVREMYDEIIEAIENHRQATTSGKAAKWRNAAESRIKTYSDKLDKKVLNEFHEAGADDISLSDVQGFSPFHWVLEFATVYAGGGFDVLIGNPPWDQLRPSRDDFFPKYDERFRRRRPSEKDDIQSELLEDEEIARRWEEYQDNIEVQMRYFTDGPKYTLQKPEVAGRKDPNENNIAGLFVERVFDLVKEEGYVAQVLPGVIFNGSFSKDLRMKMLEDSEITSLVGFENKGIFDELHRQYKFAVVTFSNSASTEELRGIFNQTDLTVLKEFDEVGVSIPSEVLVGYSPEARIFPFVSNQQEVSVLTKLLDHPSVQAALDGKWKIKPHREIHSARDADRFFEDGEYPVYGGRNVHQFAYSNELSDAADPPEFWSFEEATNKEKSARYRARERAFNSGNLKKEIYTEFGGPQTSESQKQFVNDLLEEERGEPLSMDDVLLDCTEYRIVFRNITNATNERTTLAAVIPKGIICHDKLITVRPYEVNPTEDDLSDIPLHSAYDRAFTDKELFAALGLLNSLQFDFIMRTKIDTTVVLYKFNESQMPRITNGDDWFEYISDRAARLNCYGEPFAEMRERLGGIDPATDEDERRRLQAEIDAAAFHAYELDRSDTAFVLDDFHRVENPRMMTDEYFDLVLEKYDELAESGPHP